MEAQKDGKAKIVIKKDCKKVNIMIGAYMSYVE